MSNSKSIILWNQDLMLTNGAGPHPLLAQVPLTVSPYVHLPRAPTLPYTYKPLPSTLPPSSTADENSLERERYVVAPSGHSAHPEEIVKSCQALQAHIYKVHEDAERRVKEWEKELEDKELAEKRRVAPGWLDRDEKILQPNKASNSVIPMADEDAHKHPSLIDQQEEGPLNRLRAEAEPNPGGEELDRAFGGMGLKTR